MANIPGKRIKQYQRPLLVEGERRWVAFEEFDTSDPVTDELLASGGDYFTVIAEHCLAGGGGCAGRVAQAPSYLFDARRLVMCGVAWLEKHHGGGNLPTDR
jgi:aminoglycoside 3-N-acetyltransferase